MSLLSFIPGAPVIEIAVVGIIATVLAGAYGLQHHQITGLKAAVAAEKQGRDQDRAAYATAAASAAAERLTKTAKILNDQAEAANAAKVQSDRADAAEHSAARAAASLRIAARTLAAGCSPAGADSATVTASPAGRLADVLTESTERYRAVAKAADGAIIRGQQCAADYDSLGKK